MISPTEHEQDGIMVVFVEKTPLEMCSNRQKVDEGYEFDQGGRARIHERSHARDAEKLPIKIGPMLMSGKL